MSMRNLVYSLGVQIRPLHLAALIACTGSLWGQDPELTNWKSGIDVTWGGTKGVDYYEEYFYHDKLIDDHKVVYIRSTTPISMAHNSRNTAIYMSLVGGRQIVGINGKDGIPGNADDGIIRYKIDRDRQYLYKWTQNFTNNEPFVLPAYTAPFTLASQLYEPGIPVVGTTGSNGGPVNSKTNTYFRGTLDTFGDEWHVLAYADDDKAHLEVQTPISYEWSSDGKTVLLVVNPKTPCFTARATGSGQFYTTPPKAYWTPKIVPQTTYISGTVSIELRNIMTAGNVFYRINGGAFIDAGSTTVTLNQTNFSTGSNTLEYHYNGVNIKTRIVVKDPTHPSLAETHGYFLFENPAGLAAAKSRVTRAPYFATYDVYKNRKEFSGQEIWDLYSHQGLRINPQPIAFLEGTNYALINAVVALFEGYSFTRAGASKSHGQYAKEMLIENGRTIDNLGWELSHSGDSIPSRELHYRGYFDSNPTLYTLFAYDIIVANFRSDQVSGGLTPIEDYYVRDKLAGFAYEAMQWTADMSALGSPGLWGGARLVTAQSVAMILREYSTPYFGTSGFGTVQTTYPLCPYQTDQLTWKQALFDGTATIKGYPDFQWNTGLSDNDHGANASLFMREGEVFGGHAYPLGTFFNKNFYMSPGLVGPHMMVWANMAKLWGGGKTDPRLEIAFDKITKGTFIAAGDPFPQTPSRFTMLYVLNSRWPNLVANQIDYVQSLPSSDNNSDDKNMDIFAIAWYDDLLGTGVVPPPPGPPPPPPTVVKAANVRVNIAVTPP